MRKLLLILTLCGLLQLKVMAQGHGDRLSIQMTKGVFGDTFFLLFNHEGHDEINDQDAIKISDGYISLASITAGTHKLAIEERAYPVEPQVINLFSRAYSAGAYELTFKWADWVKSKVAVTLYDQLLELKIPIDAQQQSYPFSLDSTYAKQTNRFSLLISSRVPEVEEVEAEVTALVAFPNPCTNQLFLRVKDDVAAASLQLRDMLGRSVWQKNFSQVQALDQLEIPCQQLTPGLYLLEWRDHANPASKTTLKIIKR